MNNAAMTFDAGTWWLAVLLLGFVTGGLVYLLKRSLFGRIDELERTLKQVSETSVKKVDYEKELAKVSEELEEIRRDYTPRSVHDKGYDEVRQDIKTIMATYLTKDDFFREFTELDRKINLLLEYKIKEKERS